MNTVFNTDRFWNLEKQNLFLSKMQYVYILGGLAGLYLLSVLMKVLIGMSLSVIVYLAVFIVIVAGPCLFEKSRNKHKSTFYFTLPASTFEKYLSYWLKYVIFIPLVIILTLLVLNIISGFIPVEAVKSHADSMSFSVITGSFRSVALIFATQAAFIGGYFYFQKHAFAKTSLIILLISIFFLIIGIAIGAYFFSGQSVEFSSNAATETTTYNMGYEIGKGLDSLVNDPVIKALDIIYYIIFITGMWTVSFFKLRETEI